MSFVTASKPQTQYIQKLRNTTPPALLSNQAIKALLFLVVAVPALSALSPFKSLTHLTLVGLAVSLALYVHFPGCPLTATMVRLVVPLRSSVILLLSPFLTLEVQDAVILPDCRDSHV